jgi:hypothetical protein
MLKMILNVLIVSTLYRFYTEGFNDLLTTLALIPSSFISQHISPRDLEVLGMLIIMVLITSWSVCAVDIESYNQG